MKVKKNRRLWNRVNSQIFVWAGTEPKEIKYSGYRIKVPPRTETANPKAPGSIYQFESARNAKDEMIPGTALVEDIVKTTPGGGVHRVFDVAACCEYLNRDREELFDQGFAIVSDVKDVPVAMQELIPLYDATQDRRAHQILQGEMDRQAKMKEKGQVVTERENPEIVAWAMKHLARTGQTVKPAHSIEQITAVLEGQATAPPPEEEAVAPAPEPVAMGVPPTNGKALWDECSEWGLRLSKRELEAILTGEEEQIAFIRGKLKAKKEAAEAGA